MAERPSPPPLEPILARLDDGTQYLVRNLLALPEDRYAVRPDGAAVWPPRDEAERSMKGLETRIPKAVGATETVLQQVQPENVSSRYRIQEKINGIVETRGVHPRRRCMSSGTGYICGPNQVIASTLRRPFCVSFHRPLPWSVNYFLVMVTKNSNTQQCCAKQAARQWDDPSRTSTSQEWCAVIVHPGAAVSNPKVWHPHPRIMTCGAVYGTCPCYRLRYTVGHARFLRTSLHPTAPGRCILESVFEPQGGTTLRVHAAADDCPISHGFPGHHVPRDSARRPGPLWNAPGP